MFGYKEDAAGTNWSIALTGYARETTILTAKVKNASDEPVVGREVTFGFVTNESGATISAYKVRTGSDGEARIIYTAGSATGTDVITARISSGSTLNMTIRIVGTTSYGITVTATPGTIADMGGQSIVEAEVVYDGVPISGITVNFSIASGGNAFGSVSPGSAVTDGNGKAIAIYKGGDVAAGSDYFEIIQASIIIDGITYTNAVRIGYSP
jgi:hypothetical protein